MTILMSGDLENRQKEKNICFMKNGRMIPCNLPVSGDAK